MNLVSPASQSDPTAARSQSAERTVMVFTCAAHALTHVYMLVYSGILVPMQQSFGLEEDALTAYVTISTTLFGLGALPAGWLGDRWGEKRLLGAFFFVTALGGLVLGAAQSTWALAAGMALLGAGASIYHPVGNALIAKSIERPGRALGLNGLWGSVGTAGGPFIAALAALALGWRWAYVAPALPMLVLGVLLWRTPLGTANRPRAPAPATTATPSTRSAKRRRTCVIVLLFLAMTCTGFYFQMIVTMLPKYLGSRFEQGALPAQEFGGLLCGLVYLIGGAGQTLAGRLVHHREGRGLYAVMLALAGPLLFVMSRLDGAALIAIAAVMAIVIFAIQPVENALLARYAPRKLQGLAFGLKFVLSFGVGGLGTALSGRVSKAYGVPAVFAIASAIAAAALILVLSALAVRKTDERGRPARSTSA